MKYILAIFLLFGLQAIHALEQTFTGVVKPRYDVELAFPIDGRIQEVMVKEGDQVEVGQPLILLEDDLQQLETRRRRMVLQETGRLEFLKQREKVLFDLLESSRDLYRKTRSVSQDELTQLELKLNETIGDRKSLEQSKLREKVEVEIAEKALTQYRLRSPIAGVVVMLEPDLGEWIRAGEVAARVVDISRCTIDINVGTEIAAKFRKHPPIQVRSRAEGREVVLDAEVRFVSPIADQASGLVLIRAEFINEDAGIMPGAAAEILLSTQE